MADGDAGPSAAEASKRRIAATAGRWYQVLGISIASAPDEVKVAYRALALLHHPDKGGDADTFKQVKQAYEEGMLKTRMRSQRSVKEKERAKGKGKGKGKGNGKAKAKARGDKAKSKAQLKKKQKAAAPKAEAAAPKAAAEAAGEAPRPSERPAAAAAAGEPLGSSAGGSSRGRKRPRAAPVPFDAPRTKLRQALRRWESAKDSRSMPDEIPVIEPAEVSALLRKHACVLVDVRDDGAEQACPDVARLPFIQLVSEPEVVVPQVAKLHADGRKLVLCSQNSERFGKCGLLGTMLLDVFGFDESRVFRMAGGFVRWREFVEGDPVLHAQEELARALARKGEEEARAEAAKAELSEWEEALRRSGDPLLSGACGGAAQAAAHLAELAPRLLALGVEESLKAMLAVAARKRVEERGAWDAVVLEELGKRFSSKLGALRAAHRELAESVASHDAVVEAALTKLAAARDRAAAPAPAPDADAPAAAVVGAEGADAARDGAASDGGVAPAAP